MENTIGVVDMIARRVLRRRRASHVRIDILYPALEDAVQIVLHGRHKTSTVGLTMWRLRKADAEDTVDYLIDQVRYAYLLLEEEPLPKFRIGKRRACRGRCTLSS